MEAAECREIADRLYDFRITRGCRIGRLLHLKAVEPPLDRTASLQPHLRLTREAVEALAEPMA